MKNNKIGMIVLLVIVLIAISIGIVKINDKSNKNAKSIATSKETSQSKTSEEIIEITDNYFIEQTNDVYINLKEYLGKTVKLQGLIYTYDDKNGNTYYAVVRNTPGCCGNDGLAGIDIKYNGNYPAVDTWVEVEGVIESYKVNNYDTPVLNIKSIKETEKGITFVTN
ncbi:MAG: hypothetical protein IJH39_03350 [Clostridia bacterium]|nr:hypothetical protein [Clostridia bacterium]